MLSYFILGFIFPWILSVYLFKKNKATILTIAPFTAVVALVLNEIGLYFELWDILPQNTEPINCLPLDLGLYPVLASYYIHCVQRKYLRPWLLLFLNCIVTTALESIYVLIGKIVYHNGWNIFFTFGSYLVGYLFVYLYYLLLRRNKILP